MTPRRVKCRKTAAEKARAKAAIITLARLEYISCRRAGQLMRRWRLVTA